MFCAFVSADAPKAAMSKNFMTDITRNSADKNLGISEKDFPADIDFWSDYPNDQLAYVLSERMTDEELYAQILMFGWAGAEPSELLNSWVSRRGLGSVKVFGWNTDNTTLVAKSISSLQKKSQERKFKIPLFVATDQEGGWIRHVKGNTSITPGNLSIGAGGYPIDAWYSGYYINKEIAVLGINMNFAPTVDLYTDQKSAIISTRSFGEDPVKAGILGTAFSAGSMAAGVIPTAKHFPGHGATENDSHIYLPTIDIDLKTFHERELVPFKTLIDAKVPAIMSGHLSFPKIRTNGEPASLSPYFLQEVLRKELGYTGLIITDDMMMNGDTLYAGSLTNAYKLAVEAGNDIIISSQTAHLDENLWTVNLERMKTNPEFRAKVKRAARRVIEVKLNYFKGPNVAPLYPDPSKIDEAIPDKEGQKFFFDQACKSITVYKKGALPFKPEDSGKVLLVGSEPDFFKEMKIYYKNTNEIRHNYYLGPNEAAAITNNILAAGNSYKTIFICVADANSAKVAKNILSLQKRGVRVVVFSIMAPITSYGLTDAECVLFGYSYSPYSLQALAAVASGVIPANGILPVTVPERQ